MAVNPLLLYSQRSFGLLTQQIDTGSDTPASRSLVVFNPTVVAVTGRAILAVDIPWYRSVPFPLVEVRDVATGRVVLNEIDNLHWALGTDTNTEVGDDKERLRFFMKLSVENVPANGYATYLATFCDDPADAPPYDLPTLRTDLIVVEDGFHGGELPPRGAFVSSSIPGLVVYVTKPLASCPNSVRVTVANNGRSAATGGVLTFAAPVLRVTRAIGKGTKTPLAPPIDGISLPLPRIGPGSALNLDVDVA